MKVWECSYCGELVQVKLTDIHKGFACPVCYNDTGKIDGGVVLDEG